MYGWLWRNTPGPWWVKTLLFAAVAAAIVAICFTTFFPWLSPLLPFNHVTVGDADSQGPARVVGPLGNTLVTSPDAVWPS